MLRAFEHELFSEVLRRPSEQRFVAAMNRAKFAFRARERYLQFSGEGVGLRCS